MRTQKHHIFPDEFRENTAFWWAFALGVVYVFLALAQLFSFEKFASVIESYGFVGGTAMVSLVAGIIPLLEVASVPYLFSMKTSRWIRVSSRVCVILTGVLWLKLAFLTNLFPVAGSKSSLFGATLPLSNGWWMLVVGATLLAAGVWVVRRLPERR